jgi:hypothetical protein
MVGHPTLAPIMTWIQERYGLPSKYKSHSQIPEELKGLTQLEEMLIARVYPLMTVYTVKGGQRKGSKHVISFPQNVSRIGNILPQLPNDIPLVVRRTNAEGARHYDFRVRQGKVRIALVWLKENNKWYREVVISEERLSQLGGDTNMEDEFHSGMTQNGLERMDEEGATEGEMAGNPSETVMGMRLNIMALIVEHIENPLVDIHTGATENPCPSRSEDEEIERMLQMIIDDPGNDSDDEFNDEEFDRLLQEWNDDIDATTNDPVRWPTQGETPINEYTTEGYIAMAFPTLFPYGRADFRDQSRRRTSIGIADYFNALLRYKDGRFGNHPRYLLK